MVAPLVAATRSPSAAAAGGRKEGERSVPSSGPIKRTGEQNQNRVLRARGLRGTGSMVTPARAANDNQHAANDNEQPGLTEARSPASSLAREQQKVSKLRVLRAQIILVPEEEAEYQVTQAIKEKPKLLRYVPAFSVASLKDLLDLVAIGSLPVIGTIITLFCSVLIFILVLFTKENSSISDMGFIIRRLLIVLVGFVIEGFIFGVNFFPFEIATVAVIYFMDKHLSEKKIAGLRNIAGVLAKKSP